MGTILLKPSSEAVVVEEQRNIYTADEESDDAKLAPRGANLIAAQNSLTIGTPITIKNVNTEEKTEHQLKLFNITGLQKYCSEKFKYSPKKTLEIAQKLYETEKCLSYPRTPPTVLGYGNVDLYQENVLINSISIILSRSFS